MLPFLHYKWKQLIRLIVINISNIATSHPKCSKPDTDYLNSSRVLLRVQIEASDGEFSGSVPRCHKLYSQCLTHALAPQCKQPLHLLLTHLSPLITTVISQFFIFVRQRELSSQTLRSGVPECAWKKVKWDIKMRKQTENM